jgi:oxygen-independent coproporphyrinogen-3 oxidase
LRRNFQGYTTDAAGALIGLGASAIGSLPQGYVQNATDIRAYERAVNDGRFATCRGVALATEDRARRALIEDLMCRFEADLAAYPALAGLDAAQLLDDMLDDGLARIDGRKLRITETGKPFVRAVCARFDAYLPRRTAKHSVAV